MREVFLPIPFLMLKVSPPTIVLYAIFRRWYTRFYHANMRTDVGPLRYILVTPQSHRIHHSRESHAATRISLAVVLFLLVNAHRHSLILVCAIVIFLSCSPQSRPDFIRWEFLPP